VTASTDPPSTGPTSDRIDVLDELTDAEQERVRSLLDAATEADDVAPVSEHVVLKLGAAADDAGRHLLLHRPGPAGTTGTATPDSTAELRGYAYLEDTASTDGQAGIRDVELVVQPAHRRAGRGRAMLQKAADGAAAGGVRAWSHGDHPGARALAQALGYRVVRTLLQWRRPLGSADEFDLPVFPPGVTVRGFRPGADDAEWLRLNARAFAHHPEQGRTTHADLQARMAEPWFDPAGFLIAERDGVMVGFHWTKVHPGGLGEVYVLGVDPDLHGGGLGRALTLAGLRHLAGQGLHTALLYVESDNAPALAVYRRLGFTPWSTDVMYAAGPDPTP
jgi:mycothiol synthase